MNNSVQDIVNKIPTYLYFSEIPDRQQALKYVNYLYQNVPQSKNVDQDKLFREVIARELRIVSMKIIEPEILVMIALNRITLEDFTLSSDNLVKKVISENPDKYDLDVLYRILAQIMTKIPKDLKDRITGKQKLQIFQLGAKFINIEPKLLEKFIAFDPSINTPISMELDQNDYKTLNEKYLRELYNFQKKQPYLNSNSMEYGALASKIEQTMPTMKPSNNLKAEYIDENPELMVGAKDKKLYYFDSSSGTLSEMPINGNQTPVSLDDIKTVLSSSKINQSDIQNVVSSLNMPAITAPLPTETASFIDKLENMFFGLGTGATQAQAVIATQAKLPDHSPIPPAFLTKLYDMKKGNTKQYTESNYDIDLGYTPSDVNSDGSRLTNYKSSSASSYVPNYKSSPARSYIPNWDYYNNRTFDQKYDDYQAARDKQDYLIWGVKRTKLTNPATTYAAFSGPGSSVNTTKAATATTSNPITTPAATTSNPTTTPAATTSNPTTTPAATTPSPTTTSISNFNNMNNDVVSKIKNNNRDIENLALGFVTVIVLIFLLVIFNTIRNNKQK
jgi:hypothetical protein